MHVLADTPPSGASSLPHWGASVVELAALVFDGFGEGAGFVLFITQRRLFEGGDGGQEFFAGFGDAKNVFLGLRLRLSPIFGLRLSFDLRPGLNVRLGFSFDRAITQQVIEV